MSKTQVKKAAWIYIAAFLLFVLNFHAEASNSIASKKLKASSTQKGANMTTVIMETSLGNIEIELDGEKAPNTTANFLKYVDDKFYDGLIFHRVISTFMIQGGGMTEDMSEKKNGSPIQNEASNGLKNNAGTIAMARTGDPHSATSQFFINVADNGFLNHTAPTPSGWGYAVFGKVTSGMDIVNKIKEVPTGRKGHHDDVPKTAVVIKSVKRK